MAVVVYNVNHTDMIIDTLSNAAAYHNLHPLFAEAFSFIAQTNLANAADGKVAFGEGLLAIFSKAAGKTVAESTAFFECHNAHIDIQVCIAGEETMGWKPRHACGLPNGSYNGEKDVQLFLDAPDMFFTLKPGQFVVFFPEDVHAPMIGNGEIKKLVIKVKM